MTKTFYITTPIYYPNGEPHLGHAYTTLCADVLARYHRLAGDDTFFLTGTDEHGVKMVKTAAEKGIEPRQLADINVKIFEDLWKELHITHDDFIRTTSDRHKQGVQAIVQQMLDKGDIYLGAYEGWYDEGQEEFVTETEAKTRNFLAFNKKPLVRYAEPTWFFRLSKYAPQVQQYIEAHPQFIQPESRRNEVLSKLKQGVDDLSISRATLKWGIPLPNDPQHVIYVWIDALSNYITALGYGVGENQASGGRVHPPYEKYWPVNVHLIGKEILWLHAVYWPAMLFSINQLPPHQVFAHGWWTADGRKMSKTEGNFIDIEKLRADISKFGLDTLRYYLLRAAPFGNDLDFSETDLAAAHVELGNVLGNCLNRVLNIINKNRDGALPAAAALEDLDRSLQERTQNLAAELAQAYDRLELQQCALLPIELARATNGYIDSTAPWKLAKDPAQSARLDTVLNLATQAMYTALIALLPILPEKAAAGLAQLGIDTTGKTLTELFATPLAAGHQVGMGSPLFPKVEG